MFPWLKRQMELPSRLRPAYRALLAWPQVIGFAAVLFIFAPYSEALFESVTGLTFDTPVRSGNTWLGIAAIFSGMLLCIVAGCGLGLSAVALALRYLFGWSWGEVKGALIWSRFPPHWLISTPKSSQRD
jgi:hypothetical protein